MAAVLLMALSCSGALADWTLIFRYSDADVYADPASAERAGDKVTMWSLSDARAEKDFLGVPYRSSLALVEYDCAKATARDVKLMYYRGQGGKGELSGTSPPAGGYFLGYSALPVQRDTPAEVAWKIACGRP